MPTSFRTLLLAALVGSYATTARATNSVTITNPTAGSTWSSGASVTVAGNTSYNWFIDTYPYHVMVKIIDVNQVIVSDTEASYSGSYGSGTFSCPTHLSNPPDRCHIEARSYDYYWQQLASQSITVTIWRM
jgi:hypothetical protein